MFLEPSNTLGLTTGAEGVMLCIYVRRAKQRQHLESMGRERDFKTD
jgi:hypothetical protein